MYMLQILLHSSKTMRVPAATTTPLGAPALLKDAQQLVGIWRAASPATIAAQMNVSATIAANVAALYQRWSADPKRQTPAVDIFVGDIYSGLQTASWSAYDRKYAQAHLLILSGLYGAVRPGDGIMPYRLEMGYKLPDSTSLYDFWGDKIATLLPADTSCIINLSAVEYTKALLPRTNLPVITPKFLTVNKATGKPTFVTVHTKIARGTFASWLITSRIRNISLLPKFSELGYSYVPEFSTTTQPVFVCKEFGGLGLSVRLT